MATKSKFTTYHLFLAVGMLITGSLNTLTTKLADVTEGEGIDGETRDFDHPFVQALGMFLGEMLCLGVFRYTLWREASEGKQVARKDFPKIIFLGPACCDLAATSLMYLGLTMTYASVFQMLRGSVVIFTGILSVLFLKRKLFGYHWVGMALVLVGLALVGLSSVLDGGSSKNAKNPLLGDLFVIIAQIIVSVQMVLEEKYVGKYDVPALQAVGWEGAFGFCLMSCLLFIFYYIPGSSVGNRFENTPDAFYQLGHSATILLATLGNLLSIAFFNFFGISVTKVMSATTRVMLDSVRTFVIWGISLAIGWQSFGYLQVIGFATLLFGTCVYQKIIVLPFVRPPADESKTEENKERLLDSASMQNLSEGDTTVNGDDSSTKA